MKRRNLGFRPVALVVALVAVVSACAVEDDGLEAPPGWEEPGWMAKVRQQNEEYMSGMESCYSEYGLEGTRAIGGANVGFLNLPDDPATEELVDRAGEDCNARVPLPEHELSQVFDDAAYERMVDTRECIVAHGYEVPEPPSAETWKDSTLSDAWNPYTFLVGSESVAITDDELRAVNDACPQPGPNFQVQAPSANG